jgi:GMP synthase (glutamine-hydrolysing)
MTSIAQDSILIVDFGSQVTQLIARRVREAGVYSEIAPFNTAQEAFDRLKPKGIILSGGPSSVMWDDSPRAPQAIFDAGIPVLAICYGQQTMAHQLGGHVASSDEREFGHAYIDIVAQSRLFDGLWEVGERHQVWMSHGDRVEKLPEGFEVVARSDGAPFAIAVDEARRFYSMMFHPEVVHTPDGGKLLANFVRHICGLAGDWTMAEFRATKIAEIRAQVGTGRVICGLSGGVDSAVAAVLIHEAIGEQLVSLFRNSYNIPLVHVNAEETFLNGLAGLTDPELKRKFIGAAFIDLFEEEARKVGGADFLAQGTLYPDVIESVSFTGGPSVTIKSHHNVGGLPERMNMKLVEPLRELFKDEVRVLGVELGLPQAFVGRHPFPGPGLAIRIPGEVTKERADILRKADLIYLEEIRNAGLYDAIWQAFAVLLPVRTVGVMGDHRTYEYVLALRAVTSTDGMTAEAFQFPGDFLPRVATRIINEVKGINRVTYDYTSKPPGTIEWE